MTGSPADETFLLPRLSLVVGGARSGKSSLAERLVCATARPRRYIATAQAWDEDMREMVERLEAQLADAAIDQIAIHEAIGAVWTLVDELNNYITVQEPWALAKDDANRERLGTVMYVIADGLRSLSILLAPVIPKATAKLWAAVGQDSLGDLSEQSIDSAGVFGALKPGVQIHPLEILFPRVEQE